MNVIKIFSIMVSYNLWGGGMFVVIVILLDVQFLVEFIFMIEVEIFEIGVVVNSLVMMIYNIFLRKV